MVPALEEAPNVPLLARHLAAVAPRAERILVDGGSGDGTADLAREHGFITLEAPAGRAGQMNVGAAAATGDHLLFLHADTRLPVGASAAVARTLDDGAALGSFTLRVDDPRPSLRVMEWGAGVRCRRLKLPLGDQALFLRRTTFETLGGYADLPYLEDMDLALRAGALGPVVTLPQPVVTSARVWRRRGVVRTTLWNGWVTVRFLRGWRPRSDRRSAVR